MASSASCSSRCTCEAGDAVRPAPALGAAWHLPLGGGRHLFFSPGGQPNRKPVKSTQQRWDQAKEICAMCPVRTQCARDTLGEEYGVYGGLDEHQRYLIRRKLPRVIGKWPWARRLA
ncbi:WhiB family transcriptional regulator [Streptomyces sp. NPDC088812]|uniref:WhiB family transcriptional regulator n=1 Tax=Streptomyces sp. NPDC088812 TaxID=3365905 RepID=UPI003830A8C3